MSESGGEQDATGRLHKATVERLGQPDHEPEGRREPGAQNWPTSKAGRTYLVDRGVADPDKVVLCGESWGGYLILLGVGRQPDL